MRDESAAVKAVIGQVAPPRICVNPRYDVAIILHDLRGGGAERAMLRLAIGMMQAGRGVALVLVQAKGAYLDDIPQGIALFDLGGTSVLASIGRISRWIKDHQPAALLSALTHVNLAVITAARLARFKGRIIVSERNQISQKAGAAKSLRERITYGLTPMLYSRADGVIAVSDGVAQDLIRFARLPEGKVHYVHNPVYDERILAQAAQLSPHRWLERRGGVIPVIIAVGRLEYQKDFATLIRAFCAVRAVRPSRLIIFGEGADRAGLEAQIAASPYAQDIDLPGFCDNPFAAMARADLQVLSSRWEGFPNVLVEGMSCGAPVVATDCPSGPREILAGGKYGRLVPVGDHDALTSAMLAALDDGGASEIAAERAKLFSIANSTDKYLAILAV